MIKHFAASAIVLNDENKVLLVKHKKFGKWIYPGGHVEPDEAPDECIVREVFEETKLKVEIVENRNKSYADERASVLHNPYAILEETIGKEEDQTHHVDLIYICRIVGDTDIEHNEEESEDIGFFGIEEIRTIDMFDNLRKLLLSFLESNQIKPKNVGK